MIEVCVFDAYGTLFDVAAAARIAAAEPGAEAWAERWPALAADWRRKQLEYSWLRAVAGRHADFRQVTGEALDWALAANGLAQAGLRPRLMALYDELAAYPEVPAMLAALAGQGMRLAILSNGSEAMLASAVRSAGLGARFEAVLSVDRVGVFKPHPSVYDLVGQAMGVAPSAVLFVSSNGWDACAGAGYGFRTAWVNRDGAPMDGLWARPAHVLRDLAALPGLVASLNL